jgi:hypothetical protein
MTKKQTENPTPDGTQVHMVNAPHQIAVIIDGVIQDVIAVPDRMAALLLSEPTFAYFNGAVLPTDPEARNVIGQTRLDEETNEWVHTEQDGSERREPVPAHPWAQEADSE